MYDFIGTTKYAPREAHKGLPQSRRSDIEAWIYVVSFYIKIQYIF